MPPRGKRKAIATAISTKGMDAKLSDHFLWISTRYRLARRVAFCSRSWTACTVPLSLSRAAPAARGAAGVGADASGAAAPGTDPGLPAGLSCAAAGGFAVPHLTALERAANAPQ